MNHQISNIKRSEPWFETHLDSITGQDEWTKKDEISGIKFRDKRISTILLKHLISYQTKEEGIITNLDVIVVELLEWLC